MAQIALAGGGTRQYTYDSNGNLTQEVQRDVGNNVIAAKGRNGSYTSFNMPVTLANPSATLTFTYGSEHQRIKQVSPSATTIYVHPDNVGGLAYEKDIKAGGVIEHKHYITAAGEVVAMVKQTTAGTSTIYFHRDHLGSTTATTNESGTVLERFAYEPFGKRRTPAGALDPNGNLAGVTTDRGFTNHEELDELGVIHMNGRVFDPAIGRFMTADLNVPYATNIQSYNRYSYTRNNPLVLIDPSGFVEKTAGPDGFGQITVGAPLVKTIRDIHVSGGVDYCDTGFRGSSSQGDQDYAYEMNLAMGLSNCVGQLASTMTNEALPNEEEVPIVEVPGKSPKLSGSVDFYIWRAKGMSVGHVLIVDANTIRIIVNQFPMNRRGEEGTYRAGQGFNLTMTFDEALKAENRPPSQIYSVTLSDYTNALNQAAAEQGKAYWNWSPTQMCETQCSTAALNVLSAGGLNFDQFLSNSNVSGALMPGTMDRWLDLLSKDPNSGVALKK